MQTSDLRNEQQMHGFAQVAVPDQMDDQTAAQFYVHPC